MNSDAPHRYQVQRDRIDELAAMATRQARLSDRLASECREDRSRHLADFDRLYRCVRMGAAWVVRLDQAGEGKLAIRSAREQRFEARLRRETVERPEAAAEPRLPSLPNLPHFPSSSRQERSEEPAEPGPSRSDLEAPVLDAVPEPQAAPKPQWQIAREALEQKRRARRPPLRRTG